MLNQPLAVNPVLMEQVRILTKPAQMEPEAQVVNPVVLCPEEKEANLQELETVVPMVANPVAVVNLVTAESRERR